MLKIIWQVSVSPPGNDWYQQVSIILHESILRFLEKYLRKSVEKEEECCSVGRKAVHIKILKMFSSNHAKYYNSLRDSNKILIRIFDFPEVLQAETAFLWKFQPRILPSFLAGGFLVAQFVRMERDPSHCPFIRAMAFSASTFFMKDTKPYPLDLRVCGSLTTRQSLKIKFFKFLSWIIMIMCW